MSDLIAFLNARLDEDEAIAKAAARMPGRHWAAASQGKGREQDGVLWDDDFANITAWFDGNMESAVHAARHDPARVLREVEAKREILGMHHPTRPHPEFGFTYPDAAKFCGYCGPGDNWQAEQEPEFFPDALWPCRHVRLLAAVYSTHPDYDPSWVPERGD